MMIGNGEVAKFDYDEESQVGIPAVGGIKAD
jgi:hypothetical protein